MLAGILGALVAGGLGLPIPEELPLLAAGASAWRREHPLALLVATCLCGLVAGDSILYWIGRRFGPRLARWWRRERSERIERHFARHGAKMLLLARFAPGARSAFLVGAGAARMPFGRFLVYDGVAACIGTGVWCGVGFACGRDLSAIRGWVGRYHQTAGIVLLVALAGALVLQAVRAFRRARAQRAHPVKS
ncbi:MAG TPA: DedA family protein [Polyangia bacterium]|nr:DedA family protein [Polyangia bacterium]